MLRTLRIFVGMLAVLVAIGTAPAASAAPHDHRGRTPAVGTRFFRRLAGGAGQCRGRKVHAAGRHVEEVAVEMEHRVGRWQAVQQRIVIGGCGQCNVRPADLLLRIAVHRTAQRHRQQLRAQAQAEYRPVCGDEGAAPEANLTATGKCARQPVRAAGSHIWLRHKKNAL